jgi:hypothetical protein
MRKTCNDYFHKNSLWTQSQLQIANSLEIWVPQNNFWKPTIPTTLLEQGAYSYIQAEAYEAYYNINLALVHSKIPAYAGGFY